MQFKFKIRMQSLKFREIEREKDIYLRGVRGGECLLATLARAITIFTSIFFQSDEFFKVS